MTSIIKLINKKIERENFSYKEKMAFFLVLHKKHILQLIENIFPFLIVASFFFLFIESISYKGFVLIYFGIYVEIIVALTLFLGATLSWLSLSKNQQKLPKQLEILFIINRFTTIIVILGYYLLSTLERQHFPNYVFSTFHVVLENVSLLIAFGLAVLVIDLIHEKFLFQKLTNYHMGFLQTIFLINFSLIVMSQLQASVLPTYVSTIDILKNLNKSEDEKFVQLMNGNQSLGWIYTYAQFLKKNIPEDASVYIPPQKVPWLMEGNPHYFRWFLYPRNLISGPFDAKAELPSDIEYVLISTGGWPWGATEIGWPQVNIPKEKIETIYTIDRQSLQERVIIDKPYSYEVFKNQWGLLKLKK